MLRQFLCETVITVVIKELYLHLYLLCHQISGVLTSIYFHIYFALSLQTPSPLNVIIWTCILFLLIHIISTYMVRHSLSTVYVAMDMLRAPFIL